MRCDEVERLIVRAVDGAAETSERVALEGHAAGCDACRQAWADQAAVASVLASRAVCPVPPGFAARVAARVAARPVVRSAEGSDWLGLVEWRAWTLGAAPVMAALVLAAVVVVSRAETSSSAAADPVSNEDPATVLISSAGVSGDTLVDLALTGRVETAGDGAGR